ncbi:hypothetical protein EJB05_47937, partial [Eragrostis curvula]
MRGLTSRVVVVLRRTQIKRARMAASLSLPVAVEIAAMGATSPRIRSGPRGLRSAARSPRHAHGPSGRRRRRLSSPPCASGCENTATRLEAIWRREINQRNRHGFDSLLVLVTWCIWKERNARAFEDELCTPAALLDICKPEAKLWMYAGAKRLHI